MTELLFLILGLLITLVMMGAPYVGRAHLIGTWSRSAGSFSGASMCVFGMGNRCQGSIFVPGRGAHGE